MAKEYIEREAAVAFLENMAASRYLIQSLENKERFPAADVAPVVHGEWIKISYTTLYKCSNCTHMTDMPYQKKLFNYCPNCSARMDGGNKNG